MQHALLLNNWILMKWKQCQILNSFSIVIECTLHRAIYNLQWLSIGFWLLGIVILVVYWQYAYTKEDSLFQNGGFFSLIANIND